MKTVFIASRIRGFFRQLIASKGINVSFSCNSNNIYEINSFRTKLKNTIGRSRLFDYLGFIQIPKCKTCCNLALSFNRFLNSNVPYIIYVENPTALYHYRLHRRNNLLGQYRINKQLNNPNLKALVFMSNACASTFEAVCGIPHKNCICKTIYPLIPLNPIVNNELIKKRCHSKNLNLLYIAQGIRFLSKGGLEIIETYKNLVARGLKIDLQIITSLSDISPQLLQLIYKIEGIKIDDFRFSFSEMQQIYAKSSILLQPSSDDSSPLTVLEAMKSGLPILASRLYAIPEMVENDINGYLCDPHYWFFTPDNLPNPRIWNHRKRTIYSGRYSKDICEFLENKITFLYNNRNELERMSYNSFQKAQTSPFASEFIESQWNNLFSEI